MSQGAMDRTTFEAIEAYVLDRMGTEERAAFEQRLAGDANLRAEVDLERENIRAVELGGVTRMLKEVAAEEKGSGATNSYAWLKYAAAVAVLVVGALWWTMRATPGEALFAEFYSTDPGLPVAMGATDDPIFADAMVSYKEGKYAEARAKWGPLLLAEPTNDTLRYFIASAHLAEGDSKAAIPMLDQLTTEPASTFHAKAQWFLLLAYVREGDAAKALAVPLDGDPTYGERVRAIKTRLK